MRMKKTVIWLDNYLEEFFMVISLILMTVIMGIQVFSRYVLGSAPSWSEEITRYLFVWSGFLSVSYCTKKCISIKIEQFVSIFPRRGKALFKLVNHTFELMVFLYLIPFAFKYDVSSRERTGKSGVPHPDVLCAGSTACKFYPGSDPYYPAMVCRIKSSKRKR